MTEHAFRPRLNHVAITMDPALLDEPGRADLLAFYGAVFGWTEGDNRGEDGNPLIMYTGAFGERHERTDEAGTSPCTAFRQAFLRVCELSGLR